MKNMLFRSVVFSLFLFVCSGFCFTASAQDQLPRDNGLASYHAAPHYRESESHPLKVLSYIFHPVGWVARELIFRPLSYFASSSETRRSVMGYRDPFDYRQPECFSSDHTSPDCRGVLPYNYDSVTPEAVEMAIIEPMVEEPVRQVYFPNVNFDFDKSELTSLGKGRAQQIADLLQTESDVHVVLEGHTDFIGTEEYNEKLGSRRAEAVRDELIALGVSAERVSTVTFGKSQPLVAGESDWARAVNRRVEVHIDDAAVATLP